jgi:hypothetical protein
MAHFVTRSCLFRVEAGRRSRGINFLSGRTRLACALALALPKTPPTTHHHLLLGRRARTLLHAVPDRAECICSLLARPIVILLLLIAAATVLGDAARRRCHASYRAREAFLWVSGRRTATIAMAVTMRCVK